MALYQPDEFLTLPQWLKQHYSDEIAPQEQNLVRLALTSRCMTSHHFFASNFCHVANKRGDLTLLKPFTGQAILRYTLDTQLRAGLAGRICEIKARQLGWTTENISRLLHFVVLGENRRALLLVDDEDVAAEQATRLNTMLNGLPSWLQPMRRIQNLKHIVFDNPNPKDRIKRPGLNSAGQITVPSSFRGVGGAIMAVISEYAHMLPERQSAVQVGLISAIHPSPDTILIIDTTPNGEDGFYSKMARRAVENNPKWVKKIENWRGELAAQDVLNGILGEPDVVAKRYPGKMVPAVCPWRFHEEYSARSKQTPHGMLNPLTKHQRAELISTLGKISRYGGEEEIDLRDRYDVCLERLFFRRAMIDQYELPTDEMSLLAFRQEYLSTIESAFVDSGKAPFDRASMDAISRMTRSPAAVGLFSGENQFEWWQQNAGGTLLDHEHRDPNPWQEIRIYAPPQAGERYTMGVDTDIAYESDDSDATVAQVVRFSDRKIVATYEARVPSYELIKQLYCLYKWYNNAYYAIETAGIGYDLVRRCIDAGMANVHYYKRYDADDPEPTRYPGWETNKVTRPMMDQMLLEMVCHRNPDSHKPEPLAVFCDETTVKEIKGLSRTPTGSFKSARGHDDHVDALEIAWCISNDPYSGIVRDKAQKKADERREFEQKFRWMTGGGRTDRNRPSLANL